MSAWDLHLVNCKNSKHLFFVQTTERVKPKPKWDDAQMLGQVRNQSLYWAQPKPQIPPHSTPNWAAQTAYCDFQLLSTNWTFISLLIWRARDWIDMSTCHNAVLYGEMQVPETVWLHQHCTLLEVICPAETQFATALSTTPKVNVKHPHPAGIDMLVPLGIGVNDSTMNRAVENPGPLWVLFHSSFHPFHMFTGSLALVYISWLLGMESQHLTFSLSRYSEQTSRWRQWTLVVTK